MQKLLIFFSKNISILNFIGNNDDSNEGSQYFVIKKYGKLSLNCPCYSFDIIWEY